MSRVVATNVLLLCVLTVLSAMHCRSARAEVASLRVLFIGNSLTNRNDLPALFQRYVAEAYPQVRVDVAMVAPDGQALQGHLANEATRQRIVSCEWDRIVIQERGGLTTGWQLNGETQYGRPTAFLESVSSFAEMARRCNSKLILFEPWPARAADFQYIDHACVNAAKQAKAILAPVGRVMQQMRQSPDLSVLSADNYHPSPVGSFVIAATLARTMLGAPRAFEAASLPAGLDRPASQKIIEAVDREQALLDEATGYPVVAEPRFSALPSLGRGRPLAVRDLLGTWRARSGGTRLSFGTQLAFTTGDGELQLSIQEFTPAALVDIQPRELSIMDDQLRFTADVNAVSFTFAANLEGDVLRVLTASGPPDRMTYTTATYELAGEPAYFERLAALYGELERDEQRQGLAAAIRPHYVRLQAFLGQAAAGELSQPSEWLLILPAWHYLNRGNTTTALTYLRAAAQLYPASADAQLQLARGLRLSGALAPATSALEEARRLDASRAGTLARQIRDEQTALETAQRASAADHTRDTGR